MNTTNTKYWISFTIAKKSLNFLRGFSKSRIKSISLPQKKKDIQYLVFVVFIQQRSIFSKVMNYELIEMKQAFLVNDFFAPYSFEYGRISSVAVGYYDNLFFCVKVFS